MSLLNWLIGSIILAILLIKSVTQSPATPAKLPQAQTCEEPEEAIEELNYEITGKKARLELLLDKISKIKKTIRDLNFKRGEVQLKYYDFLNHLKEDLSKCESECLSLHSQIDQMLIKRNQMNVKLFETANQLPIDISESESDWL